MNNDNLFFNVVESDRNNKIVNSFKKKKNIF